MEAVPCDLCRADAPEPLFRRADRFHGQDFQLVRCRRCGLIYLNPRPTAAELGAFYPEDYEAYRPAAAIAADWHIQQALARQLAAVGRYRQPPGALLDVGCATGEFLHVAHRGGWRVTGIEWMEVIAAEARQRYGLTVFAGELEAAPLPDHAFDVITLWDVLEHVPSPRRTLTTCRRLLKPDGVLLLSIPNLASFDRYLFGARWIGWDAPRHFTLFTGVTLTRLLHETGFAPPHPHSFLGAKGTFLLSLDNVLAAHPRWHGLRRLYPLVSTVLWPYRQLAYRLQRAPIIAYAARPAEGG
jgi:SAM-dependent methyltransferase